MIHIAISPIEIDGPQPNLIERIADALVYQDRIAEWFDAVAKGCAEFDFRSVPAQKPSVELNSGDSPMDYLHKLLHASRQIILYGPPGTGKTWTARRLAARMLQEGVCC
jgi:DNA replication protein DnaC